MIDLYRHLARSQMVAALNTLGLAFNAFDDNAWTKDHLDGKVCQVVNHTLFFADLYLHSGVEGFKRQPFHLANPDLFQDYEEMEDRAPVNTYSREDLGKYLEFCIQKAGDVIESESESILAGPSGFDWREETRAELHVYNTRHIQHHAAQLGLRCQLAGGAPFRWVASG